MGQYVDVDTELPGGGVAFDHPVKGALWIALAEKACVEANAAGIVWTHNVGAESYDALNYGGDAALALQAITGQFANVYDLNPSNLGLAWNQGKFIVLRMSDSVSPYIVRHHDCAVVGYEPSSSSPFKNFNPCGPTRAARRLATRTRTTACTTSTHLSCPRTLPISVSAGRPR